MDTEKLKELRRLHEAATPGPGDIGIFETDVAAERVVANLSHGSGPCWLVWLPDHPLTRGTRPAPEHAVTVAITGNGPNSEANARWLAEVYSHASDILTLAEEALRLREQIDELASFIMREIPGEPSQSQGAVDTAIRLLCHGQQQIREAVQREREECAKVVEAYVCDDCTVARQIRARGASTSDAAPGEQP